MDRVGRVLSLAFVFALGMVHHVHSAPLNEDALIKLGENLFLNETFDGNGRTCATCHPPENNFTVDPKFIATLPPDDPLFVHEFNPDLAELENAVLLRKFGLFLENVDGLDKPGVFRGVPHNLAMRTSTEHDVDGLPATHALGWGGDGSARGVFNDGVTEIVADGSLRSFAIGAIIQHFPKTLARAPGVDFRLPTHLELDAMEAFMLSVGRQKDLNLAQMKFNSPFVNKGRDLFFDQKSGPCSLCHDNAGANTADGLGMNFLVGIEDMPNAPHKLEHPGAPYDAGLGTTPSTYGFGDETFNTPPLVEAADTAPFFHNNSVSTLEGAVALYTSDSFKNASGMDVNLEQTEIQAIAAMLRTINALENIRNSNHLDQKAAKADIADGRRIINVAKAETEDAYQVLEGTEYRLFENAVDLLKEAYALEESALSADHKHSRNKLLREAAHLKEEAHRLMVN